MQSHEAQPDTYTQAKVRLRLPFRLAVVAGMGFVGSRGDDWHGRIGFEHKDLIITGEGWEDEPWPVTIVTLSVTLPAGDIATPPSPEDVARLFSHMVGYLNFFIDSYCIALQDYHVRTIITSDLPPTTTVWINDVAYTLLLRDLSDSAIPPDEDEQPIMAAIGSVLASFETPWAEPLFIERFYVDARQCIARGEFVRAIVSLETAFELKVNLALKMVLRHAGVPETEQQGILKAPLRNKIEIHLPKYLSGEFRFNQPGHMKRWYDHLYLLRNACVHEGKLDVSTNDVAAALAAFHLVDAYLGQKLMDAGILATNATYTQSAFTANEYHLRPDPDVVASHLQAIGLADKDGKARPM